MDERAAIAAARNTIAAGLAWLLYGSAKHALNCWCRIVAAKPQWAGSGIPRGGFVHGRFCAIVRGITDIDQRQPDIWLVRDKVKGIAAVKYAACCLSPSAIREENVGSRHYAGHPHRSISLA
jgi:hypothetical protein